jgi:hypothetical protein
MREKRLNGLNEVQRIPNPCSKEHRCRAGGRGGRLAEEGGFGRSEGDWGEREDYELSLFRKGRGEGER